MICIVGFFILKIVFFFLVPVGLRTVCMHHAVTASILMLPSLLFLAVMLVSGALFLLLFDVPAVVGVPANAAWRPV
jgi:hypothetical protein